MSHEPAAAGASRGPSTPLGGEREVIVLTGMMGVGKSAVARALAARLGWQALDLDAEIARLAGRDLPTLWATEGEPAFRERERAAVAALVASEPRRTVIATGGWTVGDPGSRQALASLGPWVGLRATPATIAARLGPRAAQERPLLAGAGRPTARIAALLEERWPTYGATPWQVATDGRSVEQVAGHVVALLQATAGLRPRALPVSTDGGLYTMLIGEGLLDRLGALLLAAGLDAHAALISDRRVGALYGDRAALSLAQAGIVEANAATLRAAHGAAGEDDSPTDPAAALLSADIALRSPPRGPAVLEMGLGERAKSPATVVALWQALAGARLDRRATVIGLGGGVVTDTAGFVAAGLLRGLRWAAVPTTLLGMVDAALGGKTGVNLSVGKNLAGAFWQPSLVVADPSTLATLAPPVLREGLAEVVKAAVIDDRALLETLEGQGAPAMGAWDGPDGWTALVADAAAVKARIVGGDTREAEDGRRVLLNLGHTFAHAIERVSDYRIRHGAAVAIGLVAAARLAEALGVAEEPLASRLSKLLRRLELPVSVPEALATAPGAADDHAPHDANRRAPASDPGVRGARLTAEALLGAMAHDKKRSGEGLRFVLPVAIGDVRVFAAVPTEVVLDVVRTVVDDG